MANWDKIYRDYKKGGQAWATLSGEIIPEFKLVLRQEKFKFKRAFDIGCGTGNYLAYLVSNGFQVAGTDSSPTAVKMARALFDKKTGRAIKVANMFKLRIPKNKYDLIMSIAAIHHGMKKDVARLVGKIYTALVPGGKAFITFPDLVSSQHWDTFKTNKDLGNGTFSPLSGPEKGLPHSFFTKEEIAKMFAKFRMVKMQLDKRGRWVVRAVKQDSRDSRNKYKQEYV
ncbi:hypothetical protein A2482_01560 [Candidatus Falkowbacteria bacterium RIFOXYC2_FULL_48_21]|uniref:Methyltransferase type 11 domain-containing protein n=1 Tax=Candidatus Falkowbacteria bacterium RIFOXYC2_FULL_48_21 TaxID=1798005 RepID=A0A1F5TGD9_9BACT|nr:MAG: hypothetical protein A2482_01560 [Candidatus Falkowbacteria bacterium RIFOXYC2_FULL_48_21]